MGRRSRSPSGGGRNERYGGRPHYRDGGNRDGGYHGRRERDFSGDRRGGPTDDHPSGDREDFRNGGGVPASGEFMFNDRGPPRDGGFRRGPPRDGGGFRGGFDHRNEEKDRIRREGLCFICKNKGHMAKDCPDNTGSRGGPDRSGGEGGYQRRSYNNNNNDERD